MSDSMNTNHYHGDTIRKLFLTGGGMMLIALPFFQSFVPYPVFVSIFAALTVAFFAGVMTPHQNKWVMPLNVLVAAAAVIVFEYYAVQAYLEGRVPFFAVNQILALVFFAAFYYATKTLRGTLTK